MMENHFTEGLSFLVHFRESLHEISRESLFSKKLFCRAPAKFSRESALGAEPNGARFTESIRSRFTLSLSFSTRVRQCLVMSHDNTDL
jgi:hypothetical protein